MLKQILVKQGGLDGILFDEPDDKIILTNHSNPGTLTAIDPTTGETSGPAWSGRFVMDATRASAPSCCRIIVEATVPAGYPPPDLFTQSLAWLDASGNDIRYATIYVNAPDVPTPPGR